MLTQSDKKYISETIGGSIKTNNEVLVREMVELFNVTNERIDKVDEKLSKKIDVILRKLVEHNNYLNDHERRIEKVEEKVFARTTNPL